ncbi:MAG TPA: hypothetical protein VGW75_01170 [Solirubrobacteraceae bacterium]|nr:hypothetical protein [Solirubrobacteraceae bacterium]
MKLRTSNARPAAAAAARLVRVVARVGRPAGAWALLAVVLCTAAGAVAGGQAPSPVVYERATVQVVALERRLLERARLDDVVVPVRAEGVDSARSPGSGPGAAWFARTGVARDADAHEPQRRAAMAYVDRLTALQDAVLRRRLRSGMYNDRAAAMRRALHAAGRYAAIYAVRRGAGDAPARGALLGLLAALVAVAALPAARLLAAAPGGAAVLRGHETAGRAAIVAAGAALAAGTVLAVSQAPPAGFAAAATGLTGAAALAAGLLGNRRTLLVLAVLALALNAGRGAIVAVVEPTGAPSAFLLANALPAAVVAALVAAVLARHRAELRARVPRPLALGVLAIAGAAVLSLAGRSTGLSLYAVGFAQYLLYPLLACALVALLRARDLPLVPLALAASGILVAATIAIQAAGIADFSQEWFGGPDDAQRFGGATGSYLHASIFLGALFALPLAFAATARGGRARAAAVAAIVALAGGLALTYGRAGWALALAASALVTVVASPSGRRTIAVVGAVAVVSALPAAALVGLSPGKLGDRALSAFDWSSDEGNVLRVREMRRSLERYAGGSAVQKLVGQGVGSTGNAAKLTPGEEVAATESYLVKLLVEVGAVGFAAIVAFLAWCVLCLLRLLRLRERPLAQRAVAAAALALTLDFALYPVLEAQLLATVWWAALATAVVTLALAPRPRAA